MTCLLAHNHNIINIQAPELQTDGQPRLKTCAEDQKIKEIGNGYWNFNKDISTCFCGSLFCNEADKTVSAPADCYKNSNICKVGSREERWFRVEDWVLAGHTIGLLTIPLGRLRRSPTVAPPLALVLVLVRIRGRTYGAEYNCAIVTREGYGGHQLILQCPPVLESDQTTKVGSWQ